ncbi:hypothetical protein N7494_007904 [Penicillium frequentans]|uniref:Uncharacterized protein n=1 Tax=Penicillium frequentans TaxID=3151616 RepID=A0AAD6CTZ7_9EURO|nr:hypothetical protein N7494_007904 [Penicillium glabrum]
MKLSIAACFIVLASLGLASPLEPQNGENECPKDCHGGCYDSAWKDCEKQIPQYNCERIAMEAKQWYWCP